MKNVEITETVTVTSDLSGKEATQERTFSVGDSGPLHMDVTDAEAERFDKALAKFLEVATPIKKASVKSDGEGAKIRAWASENGIEVGARGRLSDELREKYLAAQSA